MKYTIQSVKYIFKNFWYILPFVIIPALFFAMSTDQEAIYCVIDVLFNGDVSSFHFSHLFRAISFLNFASWKAVVFGLLAIVVVIISVAMLLALLDKHMRIGKRTYNGLLSKLNDNLISTAGYTLLLLIIYEVWALITAALIDLFSIIPNPTFAYVFIGLVFIAMHVLLVYLIGTIYLWLPCMQITGFKAIEALQYSHQLVSTVKWRILIEQAFSLFFVEGLTALCVYFAPYQWMSVCFTTILYAMLIMIYCVRMNIAYCDRDNIQRADLTKYY